MASYLQARQHNGQWQLRIDNIDPPREQQGAARRIVQSLHAHGFHWDGPVQYQREHSDRYEQALALLRESKLAYYCHCSRKSISSRIYPGTCRDRRLAVDANALRFRVAGNVVFNDLIQGNQQQNLEREVGDFVIKRRDGLYSYQLANVVDDAVEGVTHIVRGADLLNNTPRQIALFKALFNAEELSVLEVSTPEYAHVPVALDAQGFKLSKQTLAPALDSSCASANLLAAWRFLDQSDSLVCGSTEAFWHQAVRDWDIRLISRREKRWVN